MKALRPRLLLRWRCCPPLIVVIQRRHRVLMTCTLAAFALWRCVEGAAAPPATEKLAAEASAAPTLTHSEGGVPASAAAARGANEDAEPPTADRAAEAVSIAASSATSCTDRRLLCATGRYVARSASTATLLTSLEQHSYAGRTLGCCEDAQVTLRCTR